MKYRCIDSAVKTAHEHSIKQGKWCSAKAEDGTCMSDKPLNINDDYCSGRLVKCCSNCDICPSRFICWTS